MILDLRPCEHVMCVPRSLHVTHGGDVQRPIPCFRL